MNDKHAAASPERDESQQLNKNDAFMCFGITALVYVALSAVLGSVQNTVEKGSAVWWICLVVTSLGLGACAAVYLRCTHRNPWKQATLDVAPNPLHTVFACVCVLGLMCFMAPLTNWIYDLMEKAGLPRPSVDLPRQLVPLLLTATFVPAVCEELVFRGVVAQGLVRGMRNKTLAVVVSGALFSLFHANPAQTLHQFAVGCLLSVLLIRGGSLWSCVIVHFVNNLAAVVCEFVLPEAVFTSWITCLVGGVVAIGSFVAYILLVKPAPHAFDPGERQTTPFAPVPTMLFALSVVVFVVLWVVAL